MEDLVWETSAGCRRWWFVLDKGGEDHILTAMREELRWQARQGGLRGLRTSGKASDSVGFGTRVLESGQAGTKLPLGCLMEGLP